MLPILRILPVGGALLAVLILVLALSPPDGARSSLNTVIAPARGALVDRDRHPEVRQFLILAALRRANELNRLRDIPDTPVRTESAPEAARVADLPSERGDAEPEETSSANEPPGDSLPTEIGEPSSADLPATTQEQTPPAVKEPERAKPAREARHRAARRTHHVRAAANVVSQRPFNLFEILFGGQQYRQPAFNTQQASQPPMTYIYPVPRSAY